MIPVTTNMPQNFTLGAPSTFVNDYQGFTITRNISGDLPLHGYVDVTISIAPPPSLAVAKTVEYIETLKSIPIPGGSSLPLEIAFVTDAPQQLRMNPNAESFTLAKTYLPNDNLPLTYTYRLRIKKNNDEATNDITNEDLLAAHNQSNAIIPSVSLLTAPFKWYLQILNLQ
jgi:hypothetical protein